MKAQTRGLVATGLVVVSSVGVQELGEVFRDCDVCPEMAVVPGRGTPESRTIRTRRGTGSARDSETDEYSGRPWKPWLAKGLPIERSTQKQHKGRVPKEKHS